MKKILLLVLLIPFLVNSQVSFLDEKNGFKDIKLGTDVRDYDYINKIEDRKSSEIRLNWRFGGNLMYEKQLSSYGHEYMVDLTKIKSPHPFYLTKAIWVETYNNLISRITIIVDGGGSVGWADKGVYNTFVKLLGSPNEYDSSGGQKGLLETTWATWKAEKIHLDLSSIHNRGPSSIINGVAYYYLEDKRRIGWRIKYTDQELNYKNILSEENKRKKRDEENLKKLKDKF